MVVRFTAHVGDPTQWSSGTAVAAIATVGMLALVIEHLIVRHGRLRLRHLTTPVAVLVGFALAAVVAPVAGSALAQDEPKGLPDLISDPPFIWFAKTVEVADGNFARVLAFDGYIHNIGTGRLELSGNPQIDGGVKQRVFDGESWQEVSTPTVIFETDDGHNHFHLKEAIHYALWDDARTSPIGDASKVGFCLIDTEDMQESSQAYYTIEDSNYCGVDSPDATELTMGISPGWRDTYDANVTMQWVDVSNVAPGRYWVSAVTDPKDQIVEANEDNNDIVFSMNRFAVDGYVARPLDVQPANEPIRLKADTYGTVGDLAFVIAVGPTNGRLDVPVGVDLHSAEVTYTPNAGFTGIDSFSYYAHDVTSGYPIEPAPVTVEVDAGAASPAAEAEPRPLATQVAIADLDSQQIEFYRSVELQPELRGLADLEDPSPTWYARDLPPGLRIDAESGLVTGYPTLVGEFESTLVATFGDEKRTTTVGWVVERPTTPTMHGTNDISTTLSDRLSLPLGVGNRDATYEGDGLPAGGSVVTNLPIVAGNPEEIGDFDIEVRELVDGEVVNTIRFTWTVRPSARPEFAL